MRTRLLAGLIAVLVPACLANEITGIGDDPIDMGSGSGSGSNPDPTAPRVVVTVDQGTVTTDLNVEKTVTVTVTGEVGFSGDVTLAASAADGSNPITDWTTTLANTTLTVTENGTATTTLKLNAMGDAALIAGSVKIAATSSAAPAEASVAVTFNPVLVIPFAASGANCVYPDGHGVNNPWRLKTNRTIRVMNGSATLNLVVHTAGAITGFDHESNTGTAPLAGYEATVSVADEQDVFYCHNPGNGTAIIEGANSGVRNYLRVVP